MPNIYYNVTTKLSICLKAKACCVDRNIKNKILSIKDCSNSIINIKKTMVSI